MSYCRFYNTTIDLQDCINVLEDRDGFSDMSEDEKRAVVKLMTNLLERLNTIKEDIECNYQEDINPEIVMKWLEEN